MTFCFNASFVVVKHWYTFIYPEYKRNKKIKLYRVQNLKKKTTQSVKTDPLIYGWVTIKLSIF